jgi:hypothetical protein
MNTKNIKAIFFILIFLTSKIGVALNVHYCGGHIQEISLAWNIEGCGMSTEKSKDTHQDVNFTKNHCCQDKTVFIQNNEPQKTGDFELQTSYFPVPKSITYFFDLSKINLKKFFAKPNHLVFREKIYLLNHSLIFYG